MIVIRKQVVVGLGLLLLLVVLLAVGWANTPFEEGRALLLTRDVRAIQSYLGRAHHWRAEIAAQNEALHALFAGDLETPIPAPTAATKPETGTATPPVPVPTAWSTPQSAVGHPVGLYARSERARQAQDALLALQRDMEATEVPPSLGPTHELAQQALGAALGLGEWTLDYVGAPTPERLEQLAAQWQLATRTWQAFDQALGD